MSTMTKVSPTMAEEDVLSGFLQMTIDASNAVNVSVLLSAHVAARQPGLDLGVSETSALLVLASRIATALQDELVDEPTRHAVVRNLMNVLAALADAPAEIHHSAAYGSSGLGPGYLDSVLKMLSRSLLVDSATGLEDKVAFGLPTVELGAIRTRNASSAVSLIAGTRVAFTIATIADGTNVVGFVFSRNSSAWIERTLGRSLNASSSRELISPVVQLSSAANVSSFSATVRLNRPLSRGESARCLMWTTAGRWNQSACSTRLESSSTAECSCSRAGTVVVERTLLTESDTSMGSSKTGVIVGSVLGSIAGLALLVWVTEDVLKRRRAQSQYRHFQSKMTHAAMRRTASVASGPSIELDDLGEEGWGGDHRTERFSIDDDGTLDMAARRHFVRVSESGSSDYSIA
jgi:hypothetical protein